MPVAQAARLLCALALALAGSGCGHATVARDGQVQVSLTEYRLIPQSVRARQGELTIYVHNIGRLNHNLVVTRGMQTLGSTGPIRSGRTARLVLAVAPGRYLMLSTLTGDRVLGIYGTLRVTR